MYDSHRNIDEHTNQMLLSEICLASTEGSVRAELSDLGILCSHMTKNTSLKAVHGGKLYMGIPRKWHIPLIVKCQHITKTYLYIILTPFR